MKKSTKNIFMQAAEFSKFYRENYAPTLPRSTAGNYRYQGTDDDDNAIISEKYGGDYLMVDGRFVDPFINDKRRMLGKNPIKLQYDPKRPMDRSYMFILP